MREAAGLASGETFFPELSTFREEGSKILYFHAELNPHEIKQRVIASIADTTTQGKFVFVRDTGVHLIDVAGQQIILDEMNNYKPDILCLDPWADLISGYDENSGKDTSLARKFIDKVMDAYGCTTFLTQHTGQDESRGGRGHTGMKGWRDTQFTMKRQGTSKYVNIYVNPRWGCDVTLSLKWEHGTMFPAVEVLTERQIAFIAFLKDHPEGSTSQQVADALKVKQDTAKKFLQRSEKLFTKVDTLYFPKTVVLGGVQ
jgi:AAA domain